MTKKLYYESIYHTEFDATVLRVEKRDSQFHVILDQTLFYPEGGGQPCDIGWLNDIPVECVFERNSEIFHVININLTVSTVHGKVDWEHRFELMQQHLGQHVISAVFVRNFSANTIGLRISRDMAYIDLDCYVGENQVECAETISNDIIYQNQSVQVLYPSIEEIQRNTKRKIPETSEAIRIIKIDGLDYTPCCGTHPNTTGEVGIIKVKKTDTHKRGTRIHFICGRPAFHWISGICRNMACLQHELNCGENDLVTRVLKQRDNIRELKKQAFSSNISECAALDLIKNAPHSGNIAIVAHILEDTTQETMKQFFSLIVRHRGVALLLGGKTSSGAFLMFGCSKDEKRIDVRDAFKSAITLINGKGGGSATYAQGFSKDSTELSKAIDAAYEIVRKNFEVCQDS